MVEGDPEPAPWFINAETLLGALKSRAEGLTGMEAAQRLQEFGPNAVVSARDHETWQLLARQLSSPLVLILLIAATLSLALRQWLDAGIVLTIVLGSAALGFAQERRAARSVEALKERLALTARVVRDGQEQSIGARNVVPGDIVILAAGNLIPADGRVLSAQDFMVTEATITGESFPVEKRPASVAVEAAPSERTNMVWQGTSVRSGTARIVITATGERTTFGTIASRVASRAPETEFARGIRHFGYLLLRVVIVVVVFVIAANTALGRPVLDSLLFAAALAVGMSPELLPAIISVTQAAGAQQMARDGVIVRRLDAIESLGAVTVLCTDKTGTITQGEVFLEAALDPGGAPDRDVARLGWLNAWFETGIANPLDSSLIKAGQASGFSASGLIKVDEIPYDFERRRLTIVVCEQAASDHLMVTKGAFGEVLKICTDVLVPGGKAPLDDARRNALRNLFRTKSEQGLRVLAVATRRLEPRPDYTRTDEGEMTFRGFLLFSDPPKPDAAETILKLRGLGIAIKVISGDNRHVTAHVAEVVGLDHKALLTGHEIAVMSDEALWQRAPRTDLFVEIDPQQKERIVRALQRTGEAVGYVGDGINDAPALHAADVGISVAEAVDVAREGADIVLTRRDLGVLAAGIEGGRRTSANTLKYISITTSANFGNMISMAIVTPLLPFLPLLPKQILLNNFLSDIPLATVAGDDVEPELLARPRHLDTREILRFMIVFGLISSAFDLLTFAVLILVLKASEAEFQTVWFLASLFTELLVVFVLRTRRPLLGSRPGSILALSVCGASALPVLIMMIEPIRTAMGFVAIAPTTILSVALIVAAYGGVTEVAKRVYLGQ